MAKRLDSTKSILDAARDRYYMGMATTAKASTEPEKSMPPKDMTPSAKDGESSTREEKEEKIMEESASLASADSLRKRSVKKGKKILRKVTDSAVPPLKEVARSDPVEVAEERATQEGEEESPTNLFSLNISEEVASFNKFFPPDEITSQQVGKKASSCSPSHSSGEVPLKKRKIGANSLLADDAKVANKEAAPAAADRGQSSLVQVEVRPPEDLITTTVLNKIPEDDPMADTPPIDPIEVDEDSKEMPDNTDVGADSKVEKVDNSFSFMQNIPPADPIIIEDEQPMTTDSHVISHEEFQAFRYETASLKEQVVRIRGELVDVNKKLADVNEKLEKILAKVEENKSEQFTNGAIFLLQKLVRKEILSPEAAMDPTL